MNGYLVLLCGTSDDLPLSLHATWDEAHAFRRRVLANPMQALEEVAIDIPWPQDYLGVSIVTFAGGRPVEDETIDLDG
jgi:hypothetical protein